MTLLLSSTVPWCRSSVIVSGQVVEENYPYYLGFAHLASGLSNGLSGLAAGICIGIVGDAGVRATGQNVRCSLCMALCIRLRHLPDHECPTPDPLSLRALTALESRALLQGSTPGVSLGVIIVLSLAGQILTLCFTSCGLSSLRPGVFFSLFPSAQPKLYVIMILILIFAEAYVCPEYTRLSFLRMSLCCALVP